MGNCASSSAGAVKTRRVLSDAACSAQGDADGPRLTRLDAVSSAGLSSSMNPHPPSATSSVSSLDRAPAASSLKHRNNSGPAVFHDSNAAAPLWLAPHIPQKMSEDDFLAPARLWCRVAQRANLSSADAAVVLAYFVAPKIRFSVAYEVTYYLQTVCTEGRPRRVEVTEKPHGGRDRAVLVLRKGAKPALK